MSSIVTSLIGIAAGGVGWIILNFLLKPILTLRSAIRSAYEDCLFYSNQYSNPGTVKPEDVESASNSLRRHAMRISSLELQKIPFRSLWIRLGWIPSSPQLGELHDALVFLSNIVGLRGDMATDIALLDRVRKAELTVFRVAGKGAQDV
jgi:hypothetical protein